MLYVCVSYAWRAAGARLPCIDQLEPCSSVFGFPTGRAGVRRTSTGVVTTRWHAFSVPAAQSGGQSTHFRLRTASGAVTRLARGKMLGAVSARSNATIVLPVTSHRAYAHGSLLLVAEHALARTSHGSTAGRGQPK